MTNDVDVMRTFQENVEKKLRESIAMDLPNEALDKMFEQALHDLFHKEVKVSDGYGHALRTEPSWFTKVTREIVEEHAKQAMQSYIEANEKELMQRFEKMFDDNRMAILLTQQVGNVLAGEIFNTINNRLNQF